MRRLGAVAVVVGFAAFAVPQVLAATFTVNELGDDSDGICDVLDCTLRDAITAANSSAGPDQIHFFLPSGSTTLGLNGGLPALTDQVTIDGTTQPGYASGARVVVDGSSAGAATNGFEISSTGNVIKGLVINGFSNRNVWISQGGNTLSESFVGTNASGTAAVGIPAFASVTVQGGAGNTIGGATAAAGNVIAGRLTIFGAAAAGTIVRNNKIGVDATGTVAIGTAALDVNQAPGADIRDNVVASIAVQNASGTEIRRNRIGTNAAGTTALAGAPSANGVQLLAAPNTTIGATGGDGNVISGKSGNGIWIQDSTGVDVMGNRIGTSLDGLTAIPNGADGILATAFDMPPSATIGSVADGDGNTIANNAGAGIAVLQSAPVGIVIRGNAIYGNGGLEIDLGSDGATPNDTGGNPDTDTGPNGLSNFPVVTNAVQSGGNVSVDIVLQSTQQTTFSLDLYVGSSACDARQWIGTTDVTTNSDGYIQVLGLTFGSGAGAPGTVSATATGPEGTSELSACTTIAGAGTGSLSGAKVLAPNAPNGDTANVVDLTGSGTDDWAVWGTGSSTSLAPDVRKVGGSEISDLTNINPTPAPLRGLGQYTPDTPQAATHPFTFAWTDGEPAATGTAIHSGLQHDGQPSTGTVGDGFSFTVPADTTTRTLKIWVALNRAQGQLTATLSDGSATAFTDSYGGLVEFLGAEYTLTYAAATVGQTLTVTWVETANDCPGFNCDNVSIHAAALGGGGGSGSDIVVTTNANSGTGSLRAAIEAANADPSANTIGFDIAPGGAQTIALDSILPPLADIVTIDGTTQSGYSGTPLIRIHGTGGGSGASLRIDADDSVVRGLSLTGFLGDAIVLEGNGSVLERSYIGLDPDGTTVAGSQGNGVRVVGSDVDVTDNVIVGNTDYGVFVDGAVGTRIVANRIGILPGGGPAGNSIGVSIGSPFVGGTADTDISQNAIAFNTGLGIDIRGDGVTENTVDGPVDRENFPIIANTDATGPSSFVVVGTYADRVAGTENRAVRIELFRNIACDASGNGEGQEYLGTTTVLTGDSGGANWSISVPQALSALTGSALTATAFQPGPLTNHSTSEFSDCLAVGTGPPPLIADLTINGPPTTNAGASTVPLAGIPPAALVVPQIEGAQAAPVNQLPVNQSPVNQLPVNQLPVNQSPVNQSPVNQLPVNQLPVNQSGLDFKSLASAPGPLGDTALSTIPLLRVGGWGTLLVGTTLAGTPLQSVTLRQVFGLSPLPEPLQPDSSNPLRFADIDFSNSPLGSLPAMTLALGELPLSGIPLVDWCALFSGPPLNCTGSLPANTSLLSAALEGAPVNQSPVNQSPVNQSLINALAAAEAPVNQLPVNQLPVNQLPVNQLPVNQSRILSFPVNQLPVNQSPVNQLSLNAILVGNAPVNQSPVNQLPVNQLPVNQSVLVCTGQCTGTLGDYVGKVVTGATLGDLRAALPDDVPDDWTIANLEDFANLIVGDLLASLPQPNDLTLADVLALALFANNPESFAFETLNIFDTSLSLFADPLGTAPYTVDFTLAPDGGPTGVPSTVIVSVTLPRTFGYADGSSRLVQSPGACGGAPVDDPVLEHAGGFTKATWIVSGDVGNSYRLCFSARPGIVLGPQSATATATPGGGVAVSADAPEPVTVVDGTEASNNAPATATTLTPSKLYLSYLTSSSDVDYYRIPVPQAGARLTLHLSHLPADYDLVVYGPQLTALRPASASTPPLDGAPLTDTGSELTHVTDALPPQTLDDLRLQTLPLVGVSALRGTDPEDITVLSDGTGGFYTVQVTSYNGATSEDPYMLRVTTEAPRAPAAVPARTVTGAAGPSAGALPTGFNTLFVVNRRRLEGLHGSSAATSVMNTLASSQANFASLGFPNAVLSVESKVAVQNAYNAWDANPGRTELANAVVAAINAAVDTVRGQPNGEGLKYLVLVGDDRVIPQGRLGDFTTVANENGYAATFDRSSDLYAALHAGQTLSDDPYATLEPVPYLNRQLHIPRLAVGRLVETPAEIVATLSRFTAFNGRLNPTTALTTGYDFMKDGATAINVPFASRFGAGAATLISETWTKSSLTGSFLPPGGPPSITSLNGHADHYEFAPPSVQPPFFTTADLPVTSGAPAASTGALVNRLVFSMGCHSGLAVSDATVTASTYDWPQAYARNGVGAYLGNTGYGYGDSLVVAYSEQLDAIFARRIAAGSTVGNALAAAKQEYFGSLGVFSVYDEKAMAEFTLYGLPMWSVTQVGGALAPLAVEGVVGSSGGAQLLAVQAVAVAPTSSSIVTDSATGLQAEAFVLDNIANSPGVPASPLGSFWTGPDGVQVTHFRPLQPKAFVDVSGTSGHGALVTELRQQADTPGVNPVFARPIVDAQASEPEIAFGDVAFPSRLQALRTFRKDGTLAQRVVLMTGQFFTTGNPGSNGTGVQRLYTRIGARVLRSTSNDFVPPAFTRIDATGVGSTAAFSVDVTDLTQTGAVGVVKRVLVALRAGPATTWTFSDLAQGGSTSHWSGGIPLPSAGAPFEYFVQAVDAAGNVGVSTNKGFYFAAAAPSTPTGGITVAPAVAVPPSGWFAGSTGVIADGPPDVTLEVSVDGGPFFAVPPLSGPTVTGDGVHTVHVRGSNGGTATTVVAIDTAPPAITIGSPIAGANYYRGSSPNPVDFTCTDAGSGVDICEGSASLGSPLPTSAVGPRSFTVNARDNLGKTATRTVNYTVSELCVGPAPPGAIVRGSGNDTVNGTPGDDVIIDTGGNNRIDGKGGNDTICSGSGNDTIVAGNGNDRVVDTGGNNAITSGGGNDQITSRSGNDRIDAGDGNDTVTDAGGNNTVDVGGGIDSVTTGSGNDVLVGGAEDDTINAGNGNNTVNGGAANDRITTGSGNDTIDGGPGNDICAPGSGNNSVKNCEG